MLRVSAIEEKRQGGMEEKTAGAIAPMSHSAILGGKGHA
jgi:hypothetical protein